MYEDILKILQSEKDKHKSGEESKSSSPDICHKKEVEPIIRLEDIQKAASIVKNQNDDRDEVVMLL